MKKLFWGILPILLLITAVAADDFVYHGSFLWNNVRAVADRGDYLFCAFHDGVGVVNLNLDFNKKKLASTLEIEGGPRRLYVFDSLLAVANEDGTVALVDIGNPSDMKRLGTFTPGLEVFDMARLGHFLYAAVEYYGIVRYDISDPNDIRFSDSSMAGIRVIDLQVYDSRLYALDDYNGIIIYEPDTAGFGDPVSELLLPEQAISFTVFDDTVYAGIRPNGYMVGTVADVYDPQYLGTRTSFIRGDRISVTPRGLVFANSINGFELIYDGDSLPGQLFPLTGILGYSDVYAFGGRHYIVFPHRTLGFVAYDIDDPAYIDLDYPDVVYAYPGPIRQVEFLEGRLHTIGLHNWYEIYDLSDPDQPYRSGKMINPPYEPVGMCVKGDTMFVADRKTNTFFPAVDFGYGDPKPIAPFFSVVDSIERPRIIPGYFGDMDLIYFFNEHRLNGTARTATTAFSNLIRWSFPTGITAAMFDDTLFYRVSDKNTLFICSLDEDYVLTELAQANFPSRVNDMVRKDTLLYIASNGLQTYGLGDPLSPILLDSKEELGSVSELRLINSWLVCASHTGIHIFDISAGLPIPLFSGGDQARLVALSDNIIAASDSFSVKIYTMPISDVDEPLPLAYDIDLPRIHGYPNPFNPDIRLVLENFSSTAHSLTVDIYDILGRRVRRLPVGGVYGDKIEVTWNGRDENDQPLPTGIYLFRAGDESESAVFKGILLK